MSDTDFPSHIWVQVASCEFIEINPQTCGDIGFNVEICAKSGLGLFTPEQKHSPGFWDHVCCHFCIFLSIQGPSKHPVIYVRAAGAFFFLKNDAPGIFEHVYCEFSRFS